jgi:hypothetical protein
MKESRSMREIKSILLGKVFGFSLADGGDEKSSVGGKQKQRKLAIFFFYSGGKQSKWEDERRLSGEGHCVL